MNLLRSTVACAVLLAGPAVAQDAVVITPGVGAANPITITPQADNAAGVVSLALPEAESLARGVPGTSEINIVRRPALSPILDEALPSLDPVTPALGDRDRIAQSIADNPALAQRLEGEGIAVESIDSIEIDQSGIVTVVVGP